MCKSMEEIIMDELINKNDWVDISKHQNLSIEFLEMFKNNVSWNIIPYNPTFTTEIAIKYWDKLHKNAVIYSNCNKVNVEKLFKSKVISESEYIEYLVTTALCKDMKIK